MFMLFVMAPEERIVEIRPKRYYDLMLVPPAKSILFSLFPVIYAPFLAMELNDS